MQVPKRVVLVADRQFDHSAPTLERADLEFAEHDYDEILSALERVCDDVVCYSSPAELADRARDHLNDVVLSIWSGVRSRSRKALVPAICEVFGITYVGPDAYVNSLGQDKLAAKVVAAALGFNTPRSVLIDSFAEMDLLLESIRYPAVVKPNYEGGSIGISSECLVHDTAAAKKIAARLLHCHRQPVLAEEFVFGREVSYVLIGRRTTIDVCEVLELVVEGHDLRSAVLGLELKHAPLKFHWDRVTDVIPSTDIERGQRWFRALGKVEVIRIDGRLSEDGQFHFIELSPDAYLGSDGSVGTACLMRGFSFEQFVQLLLSNAVADASCSPVGARRMSPTGVSASTDTF